MMPSGNCHCKVAEALSILEEPLVRCCGSHDNKGYFLLTSISGCTKFLTKSELDHAPDALQNLFDVQSADDLWHSSRRMTCER